MLAVILLFVGHFCCLHVGAANTLTSVNMMESSFIILLESTLPASGYTTVDVTTYQIIPSSATLMSTISEMEPVTTGDHILSTSLLTTTFRIQKTITRRTTTLQTTTVPKTFSRQTRVIATLTTLSSAGALTSATTNSLIAGTATVLPTFVATTKSSIPTLQATTLPETMTFSGQTRVITILTSAGTLTTAVTNSLMAGTATILPTFIATTKSPLPSMLMTTEESQTNGGIVAAIVVTIFTIVIVLMGITITILIVCLQKRRKGKKYILGTLKDGDTQGIFVNAGTTTLESGAENDTTNNKLNHSLSITTSDFSGDHIYEMTEMTRITEQPQAATNASPPSIEQLSSTSLRRQQVSSSLHGKHLRRQERSFPHYENTHVLHRYNSVGDYEMMKPQLQKIINKRHTRALPVETVDIYSEIEHGVDKDELYIEMKPEEMPSLSSEHESQTHKVSHELVTEEDDKDETNEIYIEMETEEDKTKLSDDEKNSTSQTSDNTQDQPTIVVSKENSEKEQNSFYIKMEPEGVTDVCTPLATDKDKQVDGQTSNNQTPTQLDASNEQANIYTDMEQEGIVNLLPSSKDKRGASNDIPDQQVSPVSQEDELNKIYIEMEQDTTNLPRPELKNLASNSVLDQPVIPVNQEDTEDKIYIEMEPDDMSDTLSPKHHPPQINSDTPDDQLLSQGSEDIYITMH